MSNSRVIRIIIFSVLLIVVSHIVIKRLLNEPILSGEKFTVLTQEIGTNKPQLTVINEFKDTRNSSGNDTQKLLDYINTHLNPSSNLDNYSPANFPGYRTDLSKYFEDQQTDPVDKVKTIPNGLVGYDKLSKTDVVLAPSGNLAGEKIFKSNTIATYANEDVMNGGKFGNVTGYDFLVGDYSAV